MALGGGYGEETIDRESWELSNDFRFTTGTDPLVTDVPHDAGGGSLKAWVSAKHGWAYKAQTRRLVAFALDGDAELPAQPPPLLPTLAGDGDFVVDPVRATAGGPLDAQMCVMCHGAGALSGGVAPDLRASQIRLSRDAFENVVLRGALRANGMSRFPTLAPDEAENVRHYVRSMVPAAGEVFVR